MIFSKIKKMRANALGKIDTVIALAIPALLALSLLANTPAGLIRIRQWGTGWVGQLAPGRQAEATTVSIRPAGSRVEAGEAFTVEVFVEAVNNLAAFEFEVSFPPEIVNVQDIDVGEFLGSTGRSVTVLGPALDTETGTASFGAFTLGDAVGPTGSGTLASVTFEAVGQGSGTLDLRDVQLIDTATQVMEASAGDASIRVGVEQPAQTAASSPSPAPGASGIGQTNIRLVYIVAVSLAVIGLVVLLLAGYVLYRKR